MLSLCVCFVINSITNIALMFENDFWPIKIQMKRGKIKEPDTSLLNMCLENFMKIFHWNMYMYLQIGETISTVWIKMYVKLMSCQRYNIVCDAYFLSRLYNILSWHYIQQNLKKLHNRNVLCKHAFGFGIDFTFRFYQMQISRE